MMNSNIPARNFSMLETKRNTNGKRSQGLGNKANMFCVNEYINNYNDEHKCLN